MEETVISSKVIGSANPIARKFRDIKNAFAGIGCGFVFLIIGFALIYASVNGVKEHSKTVAKLPFTNAQDLASKSGPVKTKAIPQVNTPIDFTYKVCLDFQCTQSTNETKTIPNLLMYDVVYERLEVVKEIREETRTVTRDGQDIQETVEKTEYEEKWVEKNTDSQWAVIMVNNVSVVGAKAQFEGDKTSQEILSVFIPNLSAVETYAQSVSSNIGQTRARVISLPVPVSEFIIVGDIQNNKIESGETFIISNLSETDLIAKLKNSESAQSWGYMLGAWLLLTIGFGALLAPIIELIEWIPIFGNMAKVAAGIIGAVLSALIVIAGVIILKFWWVILIFIVILIVAGIFMLMKKR